MNVHDIESVILDDRGIITSYIRSTNRVEAKAEAGVFYLDRLEDEGGVSGTGRVAQGFVFQDGTVALRWVTSHISTAIYASAAKWKQFTDRTAKQNYPPRPRRETEGLRAIPSNDMTVHVRCAENRLAGRTRIREIFCATTCAYIGLAALRGEHPPRRRASTDAPMVTRWNCNGSVRAGGRGRRADEPGGAGAEVGRNDHTLHATHGRMRASIAGIESRM